MKYFNLLPLIFIGIFTLFITSCENQEVEFPDFDYSAVYFAYQYPVRTIVLGEDIYDTSLDNNHKCMIYATMGGVYSNKKRITIDFVVDNSLCNHLFFDSNGTSPVVPMPSNYYTMASNQIVLDHNLQGGVEIQLNDAFFADPKAIANTYVIPLQMKKVVNADSILSGLPKVPNPVKCNPSDWDVQPKDYVLYCVKFINQWHGNYLRRGKDVISENGEARTNIRHKQYVENDEVCNIRTLSLHAAEFPVRIVNVNNEIETCNLLLTFDDKDKCTVSALTNGFTASGNGEFIKKGEKNSWGNKDRDALYLDYTIQMNGKTYDTKDTLVVRDRGIKMEIFTPFYKID